MPEFTAEEVAVYLFNEIKQSHTLTPPAAAEKIEETFNSSFLDQSKNGNKILSKDVLSHFRSLSSDEITWNPGTQAWILRSQ